MGLNDVMAILKTRLFRILSLIVVAGVMFVILFNSRSKHVEDTSIRKIKSYDRSTVTFNNTILKKLSGEPGLVPISSRGATILVDKQGSVRIPTADILTLMKFRDLEELYHRYLESIQIICRRQVHLGSFMDGGYDVCQDKHVLPASPCLVYSFGVRDDFSFDEQIHKLYGCEVHSFDPGNGMTDHTHSDKVYFHSLGLGGKNEHTENNWSMKTANTIKKELGHKDKSIDLIKIDIEAGEWSALPEMISSGTLKGVKQLIMEFHSWVDLPPWNIDGRSESDYRQHLTVLRQLYDEGFRIFYFKRFPAACCMFDDGFGNSRIGCHEVHLMRKQEGE